MKNLLKEIPSLIFLLIPGVYLFFVWNDLPNKIPTHWNIEGIADDFGEKSELILISVLMPLFLYGIFLALPFIDPKQKIQKMGNKFHSIKAFFMAFISAITIYIIYSTNHEGISDPKVIFALVGGLFAVLGNYMKTIKPNYFLGIRTPWTLENEQVWKETHKMAGRYWLIGGITLALISMLFEKEIYLPIFFVITFVLVFLPMIDSYLRFNRIKNPESK